MIRNKICPLIGEQCNDKCMFRLEAYDKTFDCVCCIRMIAKRLKKMED